MRITFNRSLLLASLLMASLYGATADEQVNERIVHPFESDTPFIPAGPIDEHVLAMLQEHGIKPANLCSDAVFIRRVHLDAIGTLPQPRDVRRFLRDPSPGKRAVLIDELLEEDAFTDYWTLKWCDLLRVKSEFPINLWPNAVQAYHRWIHENIRDNRPYDQWVRDLMTSSGSNFRVPPVNFYRAVQGREPPAIAEAVALTFMGVRLTSWPESQRSDMAVFFSRLTYKRTAEWKEEIVCLDPAPADALEAVFPDGVQVTIPRGEDPRRIFADWLIAADNPWFARNIVNRIWSWLLGRGIIHEADDIGPDNPPAIPGLLTYLEGELVKSGYDLRHIYRLILNANSYQQSSIPRSDHPDAVALFACYPVRRLDAEVLIDALCWISDSEVSYSSAIPEPFTYIPEDQRSICLADGSITSPFLEMFGRPPRDTGLESERNNGITDAQRLHLLNSTQVQKMIEGSLRLRKLAKTARGKPRPLIRSIYLNILSREPTADEEAAVADYFKNGGLNPKQATCDLIWALINSKEFLYRH